MEEQKDKKVCECAGCSCAGGCACSGCACGRGCGGGYGYRHGGHGFFILRLVIGIIIVVAAFCIGMRLGELRAAYYGVGNFGGYGHNYPMMGGY